ncbi:c-type cytochrome [Deinococcus sp. SL84]|uniref:c-type cytochrome n=1 Tax=Deinococcus sp. SL84 TaxID=2994663 RepID=UPI0022730FA6|nr:cytochrome c [Deinococcus sp. SL84]MCY1703275.1 cytochrome c [Deinococcus sp. SL84]
MTTLKARMTQGNVVSWLTGILLGLVLGVALLIVTNAGAPSAKDPVEGGVAVTADASANEAAQKGNTPETAGISQGSQGGVSDSSTGGSQTTAPTVGDPATTASGGDGGEAQAAPSDPSEGSGTSNDASGASTAADASGSAASASGTATEGQAEGDAAGTAAQGDAAASQTLFAGTCGGCHGAQGQGALGPAMTANANQWDLAGFTQTLREGKTPDGRELAPTMPRFSEGQLSDQDIANIHAWVQSL